jgi:hypothetical protein
MCALDLRVARLSLHFEMEIDIMRQLSHNLIEIACIILYYQLIE